MTKKEILLNNIKLRNAGDLYFPGCAVSASMDDYAKQMALGFVEWIITEGYEVHSANAFMKITDNEFEPVITRVQLFVKYLEILKPIT